MSHIEIASVEDDLYQGQISWQSGKSYILVHIHDHSTKVSISEENEITQDK